jgi:hypothetical protein
MIRRSSTVPNSRAGLGSVAPAFGVLIPCSSLDACYTWLEWL